MFHALLVLPAVAVFGTVAGTVLTVLFGLLGLAFIAELLFGFVFQTVKWLLWLPGVLGMVVLGVLGAVFGAVPLTLMLIFGCLYGAVLLVRGAPAAVAALFVILRDADVFAFRTKRDRAGAAHHRYF